MESSVWVLLYIGIQRALRLAVRICKVHMREQNDAGGCPLKATFLLDGMPLSLFHKARSIGAVTEEGKAILVCSFAPVC
jgi:hypothetical protein